MRSISSTPCGVARPQRCRSTHCIHSHDYKSTKAWLQCKYYHVCHNSIYFPSSFFCDLHSLSIIHHIFLCDYAVTCFVSKAHAQHTHRYSHVHTLHSKFIYMLSTMFSVFIPLDRPKSGQNRTIASCVYVCASLFTGIKIFCIHTDILTSLGWCCSFVLKQVHTVCNV